MTIDRLPPRDAFASDAPRSRPVDLSSADAIDRFLATAQDVAFEDRERLEARRDALRAADEEKRRESAAFDSMTRDERRRFLDRNVPRGF